MQKTPEGHFGGKQGKRVERNARRWLERAQAKVLVKFNRRQKGARRFYKTLKGKGAKIESYMLNGKAK